MRNLLLFSVLTVLATAGNAQLRTVMDHKFEQLRIVDKPVVLANNRNAEILRSFSNLRGLGGIRKDLAAGIKLNKQLIGSAGNVLTVLNHNCNQIDVSGDLNTVVFLHRNDNTVFSNTNIGQYRYDISSDRGLTFTNNVGPITDKTVDDEVSIHGRFPQGGIYNPGGNTTLDNAYVVYNGTWHNDPGNNSGTWVGALRGVAKINGASNTYTVAADSLNHGHTVVGSGFCHGAPGVFWAVNEANNQSFATGSNTITNGIVVEKGVFNPGLNDVVWTDTIIAQQFDSTQATSGSSTIISSIATSFSIAFDPTGQYGWISCLGDITHNPTDSLYHPIFWKSTDAGSTWTGPIQLDLSQIPGVKNNLNLAAYNTATTTGIPTTAFQSNLTVDYLGNPHFFTTVGNGTGYAIQTLAGYQAYDFTYNSSFGACDSAYQGWKGVFVDSLFTLQGTYTGDNYTEENRPLVSRSADGKKIFFYWVDSDIETAGGDDNSYPNLFTKAYDLEHHTSTKTYNLTLGDSLFGGQTLDQVQGLFAPGAAYPVVSTTAFENGSTYNVPVVLTQIDYANTSGTLGNAENPAAFWYVNNVNYGKYDFAIGKSARVDVDDTSRIVVNIGNGLSVPDANIVYLDTVCYPSGDLNLVVDSSAYNGSTPGIYPIYYAAEDADGNVYAVYVVYAQVVSPPVANFTWSFPVYTYEAHFQDQSQYDPTQWVWLFGDGQNSTFKNPVNTYHTNGDFNVCLTAKNDYGTSAPICKNVHIEGVTGINDVEFANKIELMPNPTNGKATLKLEGTNNDFDVTVYDVTGREVVGLTHYIAGTTTVQMDLSSLSSGYYAVKIYSAGKRAVKQLVITK